MKKLAFFSCVALLLVLVPAGCGGQTELVNVSGKTYLNSQEEADSRTIEFRPDGTFQYSILTTDSTSKHQGTYQVQPDKVTIVFNPQGEINEFAGKTLELKVDGTSLVDPDGSRWYVM
jgi:hypothetical protein